MPSSPRSVLLVLLCAACLAAPGAAQTGRRPVALPVVLGGPPLPPKDQRVMRCTPLEGGGFGCGPSQIPGYHPADPTWQHFADAQRDDGSWGDVGRTGLVLWTFTNFGYILPRPTTWPIGMHPFTDEMRRATTFLERSQHLDPGDPDRGRFGPPGDDLLAHTFATLALLDLAKFTSDDALAVRVELALDHLVARQAADGTWPGATSPTANAWASYALVAGALRGLGTTPARDAARHAGLSACRRRVEAALDDASTAVLPADVFASFGVLCWADEDILDELRARVARGADARWPTPEIAPSLAPEPRLWTWLATCLMRRSDSEVIRRVERALADAAMDRPACLSPLTAPCEPGPFGGELDGAAVAQLFIASHIRMDTSMGELRAPRR